MQRSLIILVLIPAVALAASTSTIDLPRTGQTTCYSEAGDVIACAGTGQDGDKQTGAAWPSPRFTDNGNGTVTDNLTGLIWLKDANCAALNPSGWAGVDWPTSLLAPGGLHSGQCGLADDSVAGDWRLPDVKELESLVDLSRSHPALPEGHPFKNVMAGGYWSSSTVALYPGNADAVGIDNGSVRGDVKSAGKFIWPVRGTAQQLAKTGQTACWDSSGKVVPCAGTGQDGETRSGLTWPSPRFTDMADGTITDNLTGVVWLKNATCFGNMSSWHNALKASNGLKTGVCGLTDGSTEGQWRLPNRKELLSLANYQQTDGGAWLGSQGFTNALDAWYWTSDTYVADPAPTALNPEKWLVNTRGAAWLLTWVKQTYSITHFYVLPVRVSTVTPIITHDGVVNPESGKTSPDITDALRVYRYVLGLDQLTDAEKTHADVAPLDGNGRPAGDGTVDMGDLVLILRKANGVGNW